MTPALKKCPGVGNQKTIQKRADFEEANFNREILLTLFKKKKHMKRRSTSLIMRDM